jgi:hypothetical protein
MHGRPTRAHTLQRTIPHFSATGFHRRRHSSPSARRVLLVIKGFSNVGWRRMSAATFVTKAIGERLRTREGVGLSMWG